MLFNSLEYLIFLPVVVLLFWAVPHKFRVTLLLVASYVFYMSWRAEYGLMLLGLTAVNFLMGLKLADAAEKARKLWLACIIAVNLVTLGYFKYTLFGISVAKDGLKLLGVNWHSPALDIILPLGISFFVFEFIHYAVEVYRGRPAVRSFPDFALFASFFATQIAGPIKRYEDFVPQLNVPAKFKWEYADDGVQLILLGLFKKVVIADNLAIVAQAGFSNIYDFSALDLWLITYAFAFQIFFDFAGYTDIARGSAMLFGYKVPINFNLPYLAANVSDFWHRWHISLSTWLRDYLFIPLGGSRFGRWFTYRNLFLTMLLGGLWHGAATHFLVWGAYQGVLLILHKEYLRLLERVGLRPAQGQPGASPSEALREKPKVLGRIYHVVSVVVTFHLVCIGWVLFRADNLRIAWTMIRKLIVDAPVELWNFSAAKLTVLQIRDPLIFPWLLYLIPGLMLVHVLTAWLNKKEFYLKPPLFLQVACMVLLVCVLAVFSSESSPKFIYFQF